MNKIVYNNCYGGFNLSHEAVMLYAEIAGLELSWITKWSLNHYFHGDCTGMTLEEAYKELKNFYPSNLDRHDTILVQVVEYYEEKLSEMKESQDEDGIAWREGYDAAVSEIGGFVDNM